MVQPPEAGRFVPLDEKSAEERFLEGELSRVRQQNRPRCNPELAAALSLIIPGAGQLYLGQRGAALALFVTSALLITLVLPWILCAFGGAIAAYAAGRRLNGQRPGF
jgi:TM2 domain-containing membrane protein YozV